MNDKRRALGRGLGALIPGSPATVGARPVDVFFRDDGDRRSSGGVATRAREDDAPWPTREDPLQDEAAQRAHDTAEAGATVGADATDHADHADDAGDGPDVDDELRRPRLAPVEGATFAHLPVGAIQANRRQPRTEFDEDELAELSHSIREIGMLQPVVVRELDGDTTGPHFELVMGERRWRAAQLAGLDVVPAIIRDTQDDALLRDALLENLHRSQLNPLEEGAAYQQLLQDFGGTHEELATRLGRSRPQITNTIRLLRLPPLVARRVAAGVLSAGHARALLALPDGAAMERLAQRIVAEGLSVRAVEEVVAVGADGAPSARRPRRTADADPALAELADQLSDRLDTRVQITMGRRKGRLSVEFASVDDLQRIVDLLGERQVVAAAGDHS